MNIFDDMMQMGKRAKTASEYIATSHTDIKNQALRYMSHHIRQNCDAIIHANGVDMQNGRDKNLTDAMLDRLMLDKKRIFAMADGVDMIADLPDPVGRILSAWDRPNGLNISRISTAIGVIGIIYESRPNVTADAGALCLKSGNAVILRGGSESIHSSTAIHQSMIQGLHDAGLPADIIQLVQTVNRDAVGYMLSDMTSYIDMIIPRGGKSLVKRVQDNARVPVLAHLEGVCHTYIHRDADAKMAKDIVFNAKMRRTGVCGATETLLIDTDFSDADTLDILQSLAQSGCEIRGCEQIISLYADAKLAVDDDWKTEYLQPIISVKRTKDFDDAVRHIQTYSTSHTESIITDNIQIAESFLNIINSAIVMHNASTQFADGGEFGMGAEIGIATGKIHARGPVGLEQLNCFKYQLRGNGQIRPL